MSEHEPRRRPRHPHKHKLTEAERILRGMANDDGYLEAIYALRTVWFSDIGVSVSIGSEPIRFRGDIVGTDLLKASHQAGLSAVACLRILSSQLAAYRSGRAIDYKSGRTENQRISPKDRLRAAGILLRDETFSFFVAQTVLGITDWNLTEDIDPRIFLANYCLYEEPGSATAKDAWSYPQLTGSTLVEVQEESRRRVFLQVRRGDKTFWSIAGGHYDNMTEVAALAELGEEMSLPPGVIQKAVPLCVANQAFLVGSGDEQKRVKYLNIAWRLVMTADELKENPPRAERGYEEWRLFGKNEVREMASQGKLSSVALCSLICAGYLDLADFSEVTMPNRLKYAHLTRVCDSR